VTSHAGVPAIRPAMTLPLVTRRYVDFQRISSAICR
jgi:hypothetical protein